MESRRRLDTYRKSDRYQRVEGDIKKELTYERFMDWTDPGKMRYGTIELGLPRFKM